MSTQMNTMVEKMDGIGISDGGCVHLLYRSPLGGRKMYVFVEKINGIYLINHRELYMYPPDYIDAMFKMELLFKREGNSEKNKENKPE